MTKILLVEDDQSLREIYGIRLTAEGYEIASAGDGEAALALAVKERPDLIISDVMMPKISGFDMLDILRSTPETANIKVIMMTALSADDQKARGESLGADRFLVKSQVGIEDVVNAVHEVLNDANGTPATTATAAPTTDNMMTQFAATPAQAPVAVPAQSASPAKTAIQTQAPMQSISSAQSAVSAQPFVSAQPATQAQPTTPTQLATQTQPVTPVQSPVNNSNPFLGNV
jgi:PAS/PAC sensor hybrid histidine kinase